MDIRSGQLSWRFAPIMLVVGALAFLLHEAFHWLAGEALGYSMVYTPNRVWPESPMTAGHFMLVSAAGPLFTYMQAALGYVLVKRRASHLGFALLYLAFAMRFLAMAVSFWNPNDEARISRDLGLGVWTLPFIVVSILFFAVVKASKQLNLSFRDQLYSYALASAVICLVVFSKLGG